MAHRHYGNRLLLPDRRSNVGEFPHRFPYLYDPWSETLPPPPTLMHAMIAISILVEGGAILTGFVLVLAGRENIAVAQAISYGICAVIVSIGVSSFLSNRGVGPQDVWRWSGTPEETGILVEYRCNSRRKVSLIATAGSSWRIGVGFVCHGYVAVLHHIPFSAEIIRKSQEQMARIPNLKVSYAVMAVGLIRGRVSFSGSAFLSIGS